MFASRSAITYKLLNNIGDEIGVVHPATVIRPDAANLLARLVILDRQVAVLLIIGARFAR